MVSPSRRRWSGPALICLLCLPAASAAAAPWYQDPACLAANQQLFQGDFAGVRAFVAKASADKALDRKACGLWLAAAMTENELAVLGDGAVSLKEQRARLDRLSAFADAHSGVQRFADLKLEATLRRVRILLRQGERSDAVSAARAANAALEARRRQRGVTPTFMYAEAVSNLAVAHSEWFVRTVMRLAGLTGNGARGKKALTLLRTKPSVYQPGAEYLARSFAEAKPDGVLGKPLQYSQRLHAEFPNHPQLAFDHAVDLADAGRCAEVPALLKPQLARVKATPAVWSARVRTKLRWIMGRCAVATGDKAAAAAWAKAARSEVTPDTKDRVESLVSSL